MKKIGLYILMAALLATALCSQAPAAWGSRSNRFRQLDQGKIIEQIVSKLDLTREQTDQFTAQAQNTQKTIEADRGKIKDLGDKLKDEMRKDPPDKAAIHELITQIGQQRTSMQIARTDALLDLQKILTPDQKEKFKEMLNKKNDRIRFGLGGSRH